MIHGFAPLERTHCWVLLTVIAALMVIWLAFDPPVLEPERPALPDPFSVRDWELTAPEPIV
jgi:hypothetical protein